MSAQWRGYTIFYEETWGNYYQYIGDFKVFPTRHNSILNELFHIQVSFRNGGIMSDGEGTKERRNVVLSQGYLLIHLVGTVTLEV